MAWHRGSVFQKHEVGQHFSSAPQYLASVVPTAAVGFAGWPAPGMKSTLLKDERQREARHPGHLQADQARDLLVRVQEVLEPKWKARMGNDPTAMPGVLVKLRDKASFCTASRVYSLPGVIRIEAVALQPRSYLLSLLGGRNIDGCHSHKMQSTDGCVQLNQI